MANDKGGQPPSHRQPLGLRHVIAAAADFGAEVEAICDSVAVLLVPPWQDGGGTPPRFRLVVASEGGRLQVREHADDRRLPAACPQRHVNPDGTFCLGWSTEDPSLVRDVQGARNWWGNVVAFLGQQLYAESRRQWPVGQERAHGDAARWEFAAEVLAEMLGSGFLQDLKAGRLILRRGCNGVLALERCGQRVFAMGDSARRVANLRSPCPCSSTGRGLALGSCGNHAEVARNLIRALSGRDRAEALFFRELATEMRCCGTMDRCPLGLLQAHDAGGQPEDVLS